LIVLGIESSCDETAAALVRDGNQILASVVASQEEVHHRFGGVVPELASRRHLESMIPVMRQALAQAGIGFAEIDGVAATQGPGLIGSLLVGFSFAKALAFALEVPWVGVNHLEGHIHALFLEAQPPPCPFVALLVSGGHTGLYHVRSQMRIERLGQTRDDAAGEAFDKVAKMLSLGYPGGVVIDRLARQGDPDRIRFPRPYLEKDSCDFSFSGIKTAVGRYLREHPDRGPEHVADIAAGFQEAVVDVLVHKLIRAARMKDCRRVSLAGGVAANSRLRARLRLDAGAERMDVYLPSLQLCGDNAAMVAALGYRLLAAGKRGRLADDVFSKAG
jgi:N6-L-threonylcarbamoyladenine synthase